MSNLKNGQPYLGMYNVQFFILNFIGTIFANKSK